MSSDCKIHGWSRAIAYGVTGEIISVEDEQLARMSKASDPLRRASFKGSTEGTYVRRACHGRADQSSQVIVDVQVLRLEYRSGWFDFFRTEPSIRRVALDRFTVQIAADNAGSDVPALIEKTTSLLDILPSHHFGSEVGDIIASGHRAPFAYVAVCDEDGSPDSRRTDAPALDIWA